MATNPTWIEPPPAQKKSLGCFAKGCLVLVLISVVLLALLLVGGYFTVHHVSTTYLATQPLALPIAEAPPEEIHALKQEWKDFKQTSRRNESLPAEQRQPAHLELSATQINQLIAAEEKARGRVSVAIKDGVLQVTFSIPLDALKKGRIDLPGITGHYANGSVTAQTVGPTPPSQLVISNATLNGHSVPTSIIEQQYRGQSLRSYAASYSAKNSINTIQIVGDKVVLDSAGGR